MTTESDDNPTHITCSNCGTKNRNAVYIAERLFWRTWAEMRISQLDSWVFKLAKEFDQMSNGDDLPVDVAREIDKKLDEVKRGAK